MTWQTMDYETKVLDVDSLSLEELCEAIWQETLKQERAEIRLRLQPPQTDIYDGEWILQHILTDEYEAELSWIDNDSGPGSTVIPWESPVAQWIYDMQGRIDRGEKRNVHLISQYCGARWGGRLDSATVRTTEDGDKQLIVAWLHDYENLKWYSVWSNPFTPAIFQWPRVFILPGPVPWIGLVSLHLQLLREHNPILTIPDDPLDFASYFEFLDMSSWQVVCKPLTLLSALAKGYVWGIISSRWSNWHDMMKAQLEDGEFSVVATRFLEGDPEPWEGANLRHGALWVDIVDKSGVLIGTSHGGTLFDGLARTAMEFIEDFTDSTLEVIADADTPHEYLMPGLRLTTPQVPYVVYYEGDDSPIQTSDLIISPAKGIQVECGGHSMPGINETISAAVQTGFGMLGSIIGLGSLGGTVDQFLKPLYEDTILAWMAVKNILRAQHSGWSRYFSYFQDGANKAYTIASLMVLRAGFWATKTTISTQISVIDSSPWMVGDRGLGHFFLGDRVGVSLKNDPRKVIHIERCRRLDLKWSSDSPFPEWVIGINDDRAMQDPAQRAWAKIEAIVSALRELGVY
jgi:hypothetical protein